MKGYYLLFLVSIQVSLFAQQTSVSRPVAYSINSNSTGYLSNSQYYNLAQTPNFAVSPSIYYSINQLNLNSSVSTPVNYSLSNNSTNNSISTSQYYNIGIKVKIEEPKEKQTQVAPVLINDFKLPTTSKKSDNTYVVIIGNEDYTSFQTNLRKEQNVEFALNDARYFKDLCVKTLGVPTENIIYLENAGFVKIKQAISQINLLCKHSSGKANLIFYYAGHGLPDEITKIPYIIPVDVSGSSLDYAISLPSVYQSLTEYPSNKVIVLLDACFSGEGRSAGLLSSRGVKINPKQEIISANNLVVFCSSTAEQPSLPYAEKKHGMFTYFLLNKYIENKGIVNLGELEEYLISKVSLTNILINKTEQVPTVFYSPNISENWKKWTLDE
jgi:hypothetical protein